MLNKQKEMMELTLVLSLALQKIDNLITIEGKDSLLKVRNHIYDALVAYDEVMRSETFEE
jgi:hypothetical protein